ncbi:hypothetical protein B9Z55_021085 [Caenorhabditis nigoni]|uniref:Uncharacterized protein n=1 Tax=Caenorhabditis nigoni TaxID=1611254 RepID=A0A2G5TQL1_9PELO|nr:hypothetical protein B9Z55_021085 [Caenorhabditis nigoni]
MCENRNYKLLGASFSFQKKFVECINDLIRCNTRIDILHDIHQTARHDCGTLKEFLKISDSQMLKNFVNRFFEV